MARDGGPRRTLGGSIATGIAIAAGAAAWAVRGRSSTVFGPSVWRGPGDRREIALTFDDGPSPSTPELLRVLEQYKVPATFFQCGMHVRRFPQVAREIAAAGHEAANHTDTHPRLWLKSSRFVLEELRRTQDTIGETIGVAPKFFRATYGVRWFGVRKAQRQLGLMHVMWTTIGKDWKLGPKQISNRLIAGATNGAIFCLHDGRERESDPDIRDTVRAVRLAVPALLEQGYRFRTISDLLSEP